MTMPSNPHSALITVTELAVHLGQPDWLLVDCRFDLADTAVGERDYYAGHIPGAVYAHLDRDLSDHTRLGMGRHPFLSDAAFSELLSRWGFTASTQVVCYDGANGMHAARLWWMLRAVGHEAVAVLDGGFSAWLSAAGDVQSEAPDRIPTQVQVHFDARCFVDFDDVAHLQSSTALTLIDARAAPRYRGEVEPIDPVAGHVPGALNRPFSDNLEADSRFKSAAQLRQEFASLLHERPANTVAHMCGSGVTACHNLLAMHHAGLPGARLFAPSWSGWISNPARPIARGPDLGAA